MDEATDAALAAVRQELAALDSSGAGTRREEDQLLPAERRLVTIMFADISGFTSLSENLDPEAVRDLMNACFGRLVPVIAKHEGTVDKFMGDEIMAVFGAPRTHENDPERAIASALEMMDVLAEFNAERGLDLGMHFGINTGPVIAGSVGSDERQDYSVMGDAVNLASRLEDCSERGGDSRRSRYVSLRGKVLQLSSIAEGARKRKGRTGPGLSCPRIQRGRRPDGKPFQQEICCNVHRQGRCICCSVPARGKTDRWHGRHSGNRGRGWIGQVSAYRGSARPCSARPRSCLSSVAGRSHSLFWAGDQLSPLSGDLVAERGDHGDLRGLGCSLYMAAVAMAYQGNFADALLHCAEIVALGDNGADLQVRCWGLATEGFVLRLMGRFEDAAPLLKQAIGIAEAIQDHVILIWSTSELGRCRLRQDRPGEAAAALSLSRDHSVRHGHLRLIWVPSRNAQCEWALAAWEQACESDRAGSLRLARRACNEALNNAKTYEALLPEATRLKGVYEFLRGNATRARKWWHRSANLAKASGQRHDLAATVVEMEKRFGHRPSAKPSDTNEPLKRDIKSRSNE